jgi:NAD(P)-dependent dehydrogenase (short-subunit alcohol dehydrogenase family)
MERPELLGTRLFDLTDKIAIVTGAGRGVGRTVALALAAAGADIVASARTAPEIETVCSEVRSLGRRAEAVVTDVTVEASGEHLISTTVDRLGGLHILVNNAGINIRKPALALSLAEFQLVLDTN